MPIVPIRPNAVKADNFDIQTFPGGGSKWAEVADDDSSTYIYELSGGPVVTNFQLDYASYTLASNERCAGVRVVNRKTQNYPGVSSLTAAIGNNTGALTGTTEGALGTFIDQEAAGPWKMTEQTQTNINGLYTGHAFTPTSAAALLMAQRIELDIRLQPVTTVTSVPNAVGIDPTAATVTWAHTNGAQKKYQVKVFTAAIALGVGFDPATSVSVFDSGKITSSINSRTITTGLAAGSDYYAYVRTTADFNGADWDAAAWSAWHFTTNYPPVAAVTAPSGAITTTSYPTVTWTYADTEGEVQDAYEVRIYQLADVGGSWVGFNPDTTLVAARYASGIVASAGTSQITNVALPNAQTYRAYVRVRQFGAFAGSPSIWSNWAFSLFNLNLTQPEAPTLAITPMKSNTDKVTLILTPSEDTSPSVSSYSIEKSTDGVNWETFRVTDVEPHYIFGDDFGGPNSLVSPGWGWTVARGTWGIIGNKAYVVTQHASGRSTIWREMGHINHSVQASTGIANDGQGLAVRYVDDSNFLYVSASTSFGTWNVGKRLAGVNTTLGNVGIAAIANATILLEVEGDQMRFYVNGVLEYTYTITDAALQTGTKAGLVWHPTTLPANTITWDNVYMTSDAYVPSTDSLSIPNSGVAKTFYDYEVPLHQVVYYRATSITLDPGTPVGSVYATANTLLDHNRVWIKNPLNPDDNISFPVTDSWLNLTKRKTRTTFEPIGRDLPVLLKGSQKGQSFSLSVLLLSREMYDRFIEVVDGEYTFYIQTPKNSYYADISGDITIEDHLWDDLRSEEQVWRATIPLIEVEKV